MQRGLAASAWLRDKFVPTSGSVRLRCLVERGEQSGNLDAALRSNATPMRCLCRGQASIASLYSDRMHADDTLLGGIEVPGESYRG